MRRLVSDLARYGDVAARVVVSPSGKTLGRSLSPAPCLRPFWHPARRARRGGTAADEDGARNGSSPSLRGRTSMSSNNSPKGSHDQEPSRMDGLIAAVIPGGGRSPGYDPG